MRECLFHCLINLTYNDPKPYKGVTLNIALRQPFADHSAATIPTANLCFSLRLTFTNIIQRGLNTHIWMALYLSTINARVIKILLFGCIVANIKNILL